ncbi:MAG TPA: hypothetical protein VE011_06140 [Candidatus Dormibacteraeota bacterium]|nr:hypothetical protein [Candidatus Dormibacteraeota bacterium]
MPALQPRLGDVVVRPPVLPREMPASQRRVAMSDWVATTFTGQVTEPLPVVVDLPASFEPEAGQLLQLIRDLQNERANRNRGRIAFIFVTQDDTVRDVLRAIAAASDIPIWVAPSSGELELAEPAVSLTPAKRSALDNLAALGMATASAVAGRTGGNPVSVGNTLGDLFSQGLLLRREGAGRTGHTYVHPAIVKATAGSEPLRTTVGLSSALSAQIAQVAERTGREPSELVTEAWRSFLANHTDELSQRYEDVSNVLRRGSREQLLETLTQDSRSHARATRPRRAVSGGLGARPSSHQSSKQE